MRVLLIIGIICLTFFGFGQHTISGTVIDKNTKEVIIGAHVLDTISGVGDVTNHLGQFSLFVKKDYFLEISFVGYQKQGISNILKKDTIINIELESGILLNSYEIKANRLKTFNTSSISMAEVNKMPSLSGKPDIIKAVSLLPGIQTQSEGSSLLMVRGGSPGQNLYLLDNSALIYINHLGGFMSVFNPDMINNIEIYKGGFPAEYGDKISSVVKITQKEGSDAQFGGSYSLGITDIAVTLEGPIGKNLNFIFTGRKTVFFDAFLYASSRLSDGGDYVLQYGFHDLNGKFSWKINNKNKLHFNIYQGDDYLNIWSKFDASADNTARLKNIWGNWMSTASLNSVINPKLSVENAIQYTRYRLINQQTETSIISDSVLMKNKYSSSVENLSFRSVWRYKQSNFWNLNFGINSSYYVHTPYDYSGYNYSNLQGKISIPSFIITGFVDNKLRLSKKIKLNIGSRIVNYKCQDFNTIEIEPRANLTLSLNDKNRLNFSYMKVTQNSHLLFTSSSFLNNEVWLPASQNLLPAVSDQISMGWMSVLLKEMLNLEINIYYKNFNNLAAFKDGYIGTVYNSNQINNVATHGEGKSYGMEFYLKKNIGKWTGQLAYDFNYSSRQFENINEGRAFTYEFNRPHNFSIYFGRKINSKLDINIIWVIQSGLPYTPVLGRQTTISLEPDANGNPFLYEAFIYGQRNSDRMKAYHRLDVGFNYTTISKKRKLKTVWSFGVYNLYNRKNPVYYYYNNDNTGQIHQPEQNSGFKALDLYQLSLFHFTPLLSYKVYFNKTDFKKPSFQGLKDWLNFKN